LPLKLEVAGFGGASDGFATLVSDGEPPADVEVTKTASPSTGVVGSTLTYTVSIKNLSATRPAYGIHLTDDLPGGGAVMFVSSHPGTPLCTLSRPRPPGGDARDDRRDAESSRVLVNHQPGDDLRARGSHHLEQLRERHDPGRLPRR